MAQPTLNGLAAQVTELAETFSRSLRDNNLTAPTFAADSPTSYEGLDADMFLTRQKLIDAITDMWFLAQGPSESVFNYVHSAMPDAAVLNILNYFDFWSAVPLDGSASHQDIATHTSLPVEVVQRTLDHAKTIRLFEETDPGTPSARVRHTSRSAALARSSGLRALVSTVMDDAGPPMQVTHLALDRFVRGQTELKTDITESAFALYHSGALAGGHANSWDLLENDGEGDRKGWRQRNFVEFMRYLKEIFHFEGVILDAYDWKAAGKATVVDLGGSGGHDAVVLAQNFPDLTIDVEDLPKVAPAFEANVPAELKSRVRFTEHDFFRPQPVSADIYLIKLILHDWPDREALAILRALVPALKPGARVLFIEYVGKHDEEGEGGDSKKDDAAAASSSPPDEVPRSIRQMGTSTDIRMMSIFSARERAPSTWKRLFEAADPRFDVVRVDANPIAFFVILEAVWRG